MLMKRDGRGGWEGVVVAGLNWCFCILTEIKLIDPADL
jgi:hypothetical protein